MTRCRIRGSASRCAEFALALFDPTASLAQAHVTPGEERAYTVVGIPSQPEGDTVLIVLDDLTEQGRRELAEREFVSNAAHELRTPLTTIIGAVEVLQAGAKDDPLERDRFLAPHRAGGRTARTTCACAADACARACGTGTAALRADRAAAAAPGGRRRPAACGRCRRAASSARRSSARSSTATCSSRCCATSARTLRSTRSRVA